MFDALLQSQSFLRVNRVIVFQKLTHSNSSLVKSRPKIKTLEVNDRTRRKRIFKEHFIENLFLNQFGCEVLEYPQLRSLVEFKSLRKHQNYAKVLVADAVNDENFYENDSEKIISNLKSLEFSAFKLPIRNKGFGYMESEYTFMQEALSQDLSLSLTVSENENFGIQLINLFGTDSQKETYLPKLATGQSLACFAHLESGPLAVFDMVSVNTSAVRTSDGENYIICGKKNRVYNATSSDIIIFSASIMDEQKKARPTLFLVDKNLKGIEVHKPIEKIGLRGLDVCEVSFHQVVVPSTCVLGNVHEGEKLIKKVLTNGKLSNGAHCITLMKKLVNTAVSHCLYNKLFNKNKYEREYFINKIGTLVSRLYSVESMTYLVTGRLDLFENSDVFLESLILKIHASESLQFVLQETLAIVGTKAFEENSNFEEIMKDSQYFSACEDTNDYLRMLLSTTGCKHVLQYKNKTNIFTKLWSSLNMQNLKKWNNFCALDAFIYAKQLRGYIHLMLEYETLLLEDCVFYLKESTNFLIKKHGENLFNRQFELKLLADLLINIYSMTAILGRASRAYCLSVKNNEVDYRIARVEVDRLFNHNRKIHFLIREQSNLENVGCDIIENKGYPVITDLLESDGMQPVQQHLVFQTYLMNSKEEVSKSFKRKIYPSTEYDDYDFIKTLGQGSYGQVVAAQNINITPYVEGRPFWELLKRVTKFEEDAARFFAGQVVLAIEYLHCMGIIYRDLKPENLLLDFRGYLKLVDFGFAKRIGHNFSYTFCGTPEYLAPEILLSKGYGLSPDWWAFGIFLYEMCNGEPPFMSKNELKLYEKILAGEIIWPTHFSYDLKSIVHGLLQVDKTKRLGCMKEKTEGVKLHKWFNSLDWIALWNKKILPPFRSFGSKQGSISNYLRSSQLSFRSCKNNFVHEALGNIDFAI